METSQREKKGPLLAMCIRWIIEELRVIRQRECNMEQDR